MQLLMASIIIRMWRWKIKAISREACAFMTPWCCGAANQGESSPPQVYTNLTRSDDMMYGADNAGDGISTMGVNIHDSSLLALWVYKRGRGRGARCLYPHVLGSRRIPQGAGKALTAESNSSSCPSAQPTYASVGEAQQAHSNESLPPPKSNTSASRLLSS